MLSNLPPSLATVTSNKHTAVAYECPTNLIGKANPFVPCARNDNVIKADVCRPPRCSPVARGKDKPGICSKPPFPCRGPGRHSEKRTRQDKTTGKNIPQQARPAERRPVETPQVGSLSDEDRHKLANVLLPRPVASESASGQVYSGR